MGAKAGEQQETEAQKAQSTHAAQLLQDYKQRWLPVQQKLASTIEQEGAPNSSARRLAAGKASTDTAMQFDKANTGLDASLSNAGVGPGSSRANLAVTGMGSDAAASTGLGKLMSEEQIDDAYTQGLGALTALGRGESATVGANMSEAAAQSGAQASADANASLMSREGVAGVGGQVAGLGLQQGLKNGFKNPFATTPSANAPSFGVNSMMGGTDLMAGTGLPVSTGGSFGGGSPYGLNPGSASYANDTFADVTRDQWSNYVNTFVPIENKLIQYATDPNVVSTAMSDASTGINQAFNAQQGATQRRLQGLGVSLSPDEQAASTRATGLTRSLADVQGQNTARDLTVQRQQAILGSPAPQGV